MQRAKMASAPPVAGTNRSQCVQVPFEFPAFALNRLTMGLFNLGFYHVHREGRSLASYDSYLYTLDKVHHWNRIYGKRGVLQFQLSFPPDEARDGPLGGEGVADVE